MSQEQHEAAMVTSRFALYYTPRPDTSLARAAQFWLGRSAWSSDKIDRMAVAGVSSSRVAELTSIPAHYGFHATLKPPFLLKTEFSRKDVLASLQTFCSRRQPCVCSHLEVALLDSFFCLRLPGSPKELGDLADATVREFDHFRKSPSTTELTRRRQAGLSSRQDYLLQRWGYPYVFEEFRFHLTLTRRVANSDEAELLKPVLTGLFSEPLVQPLVIDGISLFEEVDGRPLVEIHFEPFAGKTSRGSTHIGGNQRLGSTC